jgi:hypothetical protein
MHASFHWAPARTRAGTTTRHRSSRERCIDLGTGAAIGPNRTKRAMFDP